MCFIYVPGTWDKFPFISSAVSYSFISVTVPELNKLVCQEYSNHIVVVKYVQFFSFLINCAMYVAILSDVFD